jgi:hypothetical protein
MDEFSYLSVLLSIILGLAVTQILKGFRGLLLSRAKIQIYWPVVAWAVLLLMIYFQSWWAMFGLRNYHDWTFAGFAIVLLQTICLYMLAGLVFPDFFGEAIVDLRENYYAHRGWFFGIATLNTLVSLAKDLVLSGSLPNRINLGFHIGFILVAVTAAFTKREWYHKTLSLIGIGAFALYISILFARLQ